MKTRFPRILFCILSLLLSSSIVLSQEKPAEIPSEKTEEISSVIQDEHNPDAEHNAAADQKPINADQESKIQDNQGNNKNRIQEQQAVGKPAETKLKEIVAPVKPGTLLEIPLPITWSSVQPIHRTLLRLSEELKNAKTLLTEPPILVLSFKVSQDQEMYGRGSQFGACFGLANMLSGEEFSGIRTVAYFPQSIQGHAILVGLACNELIVSDTAEFGNAGVDEKRISPAIYQAYRDIGKRFPKAVLDKMLDPKFELWQVESDTGIVWTDKAGVEKLRETGNLVKNPDEPLIPAGQPGILTAQQARQQLGIADFLVGNQGGIVEIAQALSLKPEQIAFAKIHTGSGRAVRIDINKSVTTSLVTEIERQIRKATMENDSVVEAIAGHNKEQPPLADFVCLYIDSAGGSLNDSLNLAAFLANDIDPMKVRTVAYIPHKARGDAALIAYACQEIVLGPDAILGGGGETVFSDREIQNAKETLAQSLGKNSLRRWSLFAAMIDPNIEVFKMTRKSEPSVVEYFCADELKTQFDPNDWSKGDPITKAGSLYELKGPEAVAMGSADKVVRDFAEFKLYYHLENDPTLIEPIWADQLIRALGSPGLSILLLILGFAAIWGELKNPGLGVGAFIAICCFVLFFWSRFLGGTADWLEVLLFLTGVVFILVEIFVIPGFGIFGIGGGIAILASLVLASQTFIIPRNPYQLGQFQNSLMVLVISLIGMTAIAGIFAKWLHEINKPKDAELIREAEKLADYSYLLGSEGIATTPLIPAGKATFGQESISVVSDCELIDAGSAIVVVDVRGYRIVVQKAGV